MQRSELAASSIGWHSREAAPSAQMNGNKVWNDLGAAHKEQGALKKTGIGAKQFYEVKEDGSSLMNTNRQNNNNRRRGRGNNNNNRQQNSNRNNGFDYQNRVDNRARGNASQMLEKYKKLASDAQMNGDRVNGEYYLQFADHYFRVLADFKSRQEARQEETQPRRDRNEWQNDGQNDGPNYGQGDDVEEMEGVEGEEASETESDEGEQRQDRNERPRRERNDRNRQPRRHHSEDAADEVDGNNAAALDLNVLPPSISIASGSDDDHEEEVELKERPARKPRTRRPAPTANDDDVVDAAE